MGFDDKTLDWKVNLLPNSTRKALEFLSNQAWLRSSLWYLAGGTALALQVGHRESVDLDFFIPRSDFLTGKLIQRFPRNIWKTDIESEGTVYGRLNKAKVSFIAYPFFKNAKPYRQFGAVNVLDAQDIGVMKLVAISQRGRKRDFLDLFWICHHLSDLESIIRRVRRQYPETGHNYHHFFQALTYFADAEGDEMPPIFFDVNWKQIKRFFLNEVPKVMKRCIDLY